MVKAQPSYNRRRGSLPYAFNAPHDTCRGEPRFEKLSFHPQRYRRVRDNADMVHIIDGRSINSPNVASDRQYIESRSVSTLEQAGVAADDVSLLQRVDGVLGNAPINGAVEIDEMVRMEDPRYSAALFPEEQRRLSALWARLEWPTEGAPPAPAKVPLADEFKDRTGRSPAPPELGVAIADLPAAVQQAARRAELILDSDGDVDSISIGDLRAIFEDTSRFTAAEVSALAQVAEIILEHNAVAPARAILEVPAPGAGVLHLEPSKPFPLKIDLQSDTQIWESRKHWRSNSGAAVLKLYASRDWKKTATVPDGHVGVLVSLSSGKETTLRAGTSTLDVEPGHYRAELWRNGHRLDSANFVIPETSTEKTDLFGYTDYDYVVAGTNQVLDRTSAHTSPDGFDSKFSAVYELPNAGVNPDPVPDSFKAPRLDLKPFRYAVQTEIGHTFFLDPFPEQGVLRIGVDDPLSPSEPMSLDGGKYRAYVRPAGGALFGVEFEPQNNTLFLSSDRRRSTTVTDAMISLA